MLRDDSTTPDRQPHPALNVFGGGQLEICSFKPMTGFCRSDILSWGNRVVGFYWVKRLGTVMNRVIALGAVSALMVLSFAQDCRALVEQGKNVEPIFVRVLTHEGPRNLVCDVNRDGSTKCVVTQ
jgi:hypothetical protein